MKVIAINGSPHKNGNTAQALDVMVEELKKDNIDVEIVQVGDQKIHGCMGCGACFKAENNMCVIKDDIMNETVLKMREADGFILACPTYYAGIPGTMKSFLDRAFYSSSRYFKQKVATSIAVVRRTGGLDVVHQLNNFLDLGETVNPPSQYWTVVYGARPGEVMQDGEGIQTIRKNARGMAWLLKLIENGKDTVSLPEDEKRVMMNFIRENK